MTRRSQLERYEKLGIGESLPRVYQYPIACRELSFILRGAYAQLPKNLQSLIFQHTLTAFRLLPQMQTQKTVSGANLLIQSAEAVLPKQKRVLAVTEFRHAKIAHKRRCKDRQEEGSTQFPQDVLLHIFSFLDLRSLLSAASVCWLWNSAASDNYLWHLQHVTYFGDSTNSFTGRGLQRCEMLEIDEPVQLQAEVNTATSIDWRETFIKAYKGNSLKSHTCYRGLCGGCHNVIWLSEMKCSNKHCRLKSKNHHITPISTEQEYFSRLKPVPQRWTDEHLPSRLIVEYVLDGDVYEISSESDSDSDEGTTSKLWAFPRHLRG